MRAHPFLASLIALGALQAPARAEAPAAAAPPTELGALVLELPAAGKGQRGDRVLLTPWATDPRDAYVLRYFPGLTFRQGQAPVYGTAPVPMSYGGPALGVGLEGRSPYGHGWQLLANWSPSPLAPAPDPRLALHGFWLPFHRWGLDADVGFDTRGGVATEIGSSVLFGMFGRVCDHRLRLAAGRQEGGGLPGYGYGEASLLRDDAGLGLTSGLTVFADQFGARRASLDGWHVWLARSTLRLATSASVGQGDPGLPPGRRLGVGLQAAMGASADARVAARSEAAVPLARGLGWGLKGIAVVRQLEGAVFVEGAATRGASDGADGPRAGVGCELSAVADTCVGGGIALGVGVAVPAWRGAGGPQIYLTTTAARFGTAAPEPLGPYER